MGIDIPVEYGGSGMGFTASIIAIEELAKVDAAVSVMVDIHNTLINTAMMRWGTDEQKSKYLPMFATDTLGSFALSEPNAGSDAFALKTVAKLDGDDYILNGTIDAQIYDVILRRTRAAGPDLAAFVANCIGSKCWISNAAEAGVFFVMANADPELGYKGITCFVVDAGGYTLTLSPTASNSPHFASGYLPFAGTPGLTVGKKEDKLGIRASSTCEIILQAAEPAHSLIMG